MSTLASVTLLNRARPGDPMRATAPHLPWQAWSARRQYRAELRRLLLVDPHLIEDLGIPVAAAIAEAHKPFWRA